jgi:spoIIIJ-associated protein
MLHIEEAIIKGLNELGLPREDVDIEVLDEGSKGLFGLGSRQARIRLSIKSASSDAKVKETSPSPEMGVTKNVAVKNASSPNSTVTEEILEGEPEEMEEEVPAPITSAEPEDVISCTSPRIPFPSCLRGCTYAQMSALNSVWLTTCAVACL